jgi:hypothetical protein
MMDPVSDARFFARGIWFMILCAFLWLLAFALSGQGGLPGRLRRAVRLCGLPGARETYAY